LISKRRFTIPIILLLFNFLILLVLLTGCSNTENDPENFSDDFEGATRYKLTATYLDLEALDTYPQRIEKINSENPYNIILLVKNQPYFNLEEVPYKKYNYSENIAQYLEPTEKIQTESEIVSEIAESFVSEDSSIQDIVVKALLWNKENITYDKPLATRIFLNTKYTRSAEDTIKLKAGACTEYANVFIAFMRHLGIPARYVLGFYQAYETIYYHAWAEVYLKGYGWIPVETQDGKFGVPNYYVKLYVGKDLIDIDMDIYKINARYEIIE